VQAETASLTPWVVDDYRTYVREPVTVHDVVGNRCSIQKTEDDAVIVKTSRKLKAPGLSVRKIAAKVAEYA